MKWFRKKKKEEKTIDFSGYHMKLNIKTICFFEKLTGKHFFTSELTEENILQLLYSMMVVNNDIVLTYPAFKYLLEDERVYRWCYDEGEKMLRKIEMLKQELTESNTEAEEGEVADISVTEIATYLIIKHKMDVRYVMFEMDLWELSEFVKASNEESQNSLENDRLWTYLTILPQVDGKKLKSPEALIKFPWEEDKKEKKFEDGAKAAIKFLKRQQNNEG